MVVGAEVGVGKISVEELATRVGATRGSFYWHFTDRAELIDAVLAQWEERATAAPIETLEPLPADVALERLVGIAFGASQAEDAAEWRLITAVDDPKVGPVVARVHRRRLAFTEKLLIDKGMPAAEAAERARVAYVAYLGSLALRQFDPDGPNLGPALLRMLG